MEFRKFYNCFIIQKVQLRKSEKSIINRNERIKNERRDLRENERTLI